MIDLLAITALRIVIAMLNLLPHRFRLQTVRVFIKCIVMAVPGYRRIALRNIDLAFPDATPEWRTQIFNASFSELARVLVDFARLDQLDEEWVQAHVECPFLSRFLEMKSSRPQQGILIATGHLGSFELLAHAVPILTNPIAFVVRNFTLPRVDRWWRARRERLGNRVISRQGAFREISHALNSGWDVALLMDQNVKRNHATFVDFFGIPAATSKTLAIAALRARAMVIVAGIIFLGEDRYRIEAVECDFSDLYADESVSSDDKVQRITQRVSDEYERMIRLQPEAWFWLHRRWKTRPEGERENFYQ